MEKLAHVDPDRILFVAGAARRESIASIRPLTFGGAPPAQTRGMWKKPRVVIGGRTMLYEITLRPRFFLDATPDARLWVLAHELWHASIAFDGSLAEERRHEHTDDDEVAAEAEALADAWRATQATSKNGWLLAHEGELRLESWLVRPPTRLPSTMHARDLYTERDLFSAVVEQRSAPMRTKRS